MILPWNFLDYFCVKRSYSQKPGENQGNAGCGNVQVSHSSRKRTHVYSSVADRMHDPAIDIVVATERMYRVVPPTERMIQPLI